MEYGLVRKQGHGGGSEGQERSRTRETMAWGQGEECKKKVGSNTSVSKPSPSFQSLRTRRAVDGTSGTPPLLSFPRDAATRRRKASAVAAAGSGAAGGSGAEGGADDGSALTSPTL